MQHEFQKIIDIIQQIIKDPCVILLGILILLCVMSKCTGITYFDFTEILKKYGKAFNNKLFVFLKLLFMVFPSVIACRNSLINDDSINIITIIISILTSMFFGLITFLPEMKEKFSTNTDLSAGDAEIREKLASETFQIIMFEIFLCIMILLMCFMSIFSKKYNIYDSFIIYYLVFLMTGDMFIVLSRIFKLINEMLD